MDRASHELAQGHVLLMMAMLSALAAYLTRGRGDPAARARILQEIRESRRLGPKVADWVAANEEALARHPGLKPKEQQVVMMSEAKPPAGPPVTPSQLRTWAEKAAEGPPTPEKPVQSPVLPRAQRGRRFPDRELPRDKGGNPMPEPNAEGPHTQLGQKEGRKGRYDVAREFNAKGKPIRDIDFTDHGRPKDHPNPHQHRYLPNPTGGTLQRGPAEPLP
jgi:hypothetical protein